MKSTIALAAAVLAACSPTGKHSQVVDNQDSNTIAANAGEVPFDKQYHLQISLPMAENVFLSMLKQHNLEYSVLGDNSEGLAIPSPRISHLPVRIEIKRVYQIYGGVDQKNRFGRVYRAFGDKSGNIVYIENAFEYPGT